MSVATFFQKLVPLDDLKATICRFPLSVLCAGTLFILGLLQVHEIIKESDETIMRVMAILGCGYWWFGITRLIAQSLGWSWKKEMLLAIPIAAAFVALIFTSQLWGIHLCFIIPALLLLIMIAPYLKGGDNLSIWFYNRMLWFGVAVSFIALFLFTGGLSAALAAIHTLFDIEISDKVYLDIWMFSSLILGPIYALYWVPEQFHFTEEDCSDPPGLKFIVNWISVPMVFVYLLILYAYFIKILVLGVLPNGQLAYLITGFAGAGIVTYLLSWPIRENGSPQLKLFHRIYFPALLIPVCFHFYAVWERVNAYGITEQRYALVLSAIWFALLAVSHTFQKAPIKTIPATLAILFIIASFGPWGAVSVSGYSQTQRLKTLLVKNELLIEDKIVKSTKEIPFDDRKRISSILEYFCNSGRGAVLKPWFNIKSTDMGTNFVEKDHCFASGLTQEMGFQYVSSYMEQQTDGSFNLNNYEANIVPISKYDYALKNQSLYNGQKIDPDKLPSGPGFEMPDKTKIYLMMDEASNLVILHDKEILITQSLISMLPKPKEGVVDKKLFLEVENDKIAAGINFTYIYGMMKDGKPNITNLSFDLFFRLK